MSGNCSRVRARRGIDLIDDLRFALVPVLVRGGLRLFPDGVAACFDTVGVTVLEHGGRRTAPCYAAEPGTDRLRAYGFPGSVVPRVPAESDAILGRVDQFGTLREEIRRREAGEVVVWTAAHRHGEDFEQAVRELLAAPPPPLRSPSRHDWIFDERGKSSDGGLAHLTPIDAASARRLLAHVLRFDLAYRVDVMEANMAARLADRVIQTLSEPARWWTNGSIGLPGDEGAWTDLTDATFDTGVIGVSTDRVLVVWFMDED